MAHQHAAHFNPADHYYVEDDEGDYGDEGNLQGLYVEGLSDRIWEDQE